jgi:secreted trypsin-like serine protease
MAVPAAGTHVRVVGFGALQVGGPTEKHAGIAEVESVEDDRFRTRPGPATVCGGDSGGPAFDDDGALAGVVSGGDAACAEYAVFTRADVFADFIASELPQPQENVRQVGCSIGRPSTERPGTAAIVALGGLLAVSRKLLKTCA